MGKVFKQVGTLYHASQFTVKASFAVDANSKTICKFSQAARMNETTFTRIAEI